MLRLNPAKEADRHATNGARPRGVYGARRGGGRAETGVGERRAASSTAAAKGLLLLIAAGKYQDAVATFSDEMAKALPAEALRAMWQSLEAQCGPFREAGDARSTEAGALDIVVVECGFDKAALNATITVDANAKVCGLTLMPARHYSSPPYVHPERFVCHEEMLRSGQYSLPGTLTVPVGDGPFPAVVLVHGSGPHDRDETIGPNKPFRDIAQGLASAGVAVLAYDKRTLACAQQMAALRAITVREEVVDDALAALSLLRGRPSIDPRRVFILGHSLGGMLAPQIASRDGRVAGVILLAAATGPLEDSVLRQTEYLVAADGEVSDEERVALDAIRRQVARAKDPALSPETPAAELPLGCPASYWLDLRRYDPPATAAGLDRPLFVLQGGRDYQVTQAEYESWKRALGTSPEATLKLYPELNHLMIAGEGNSTRDEYFRPGNVSEQVVVDIAQWVKEPR